LLRELGTLGTITSLALDASRLPSLATFDPCRCYLAWTVRMQSAATPAQLADVFMFVSDDSDVQITPIAAQASEVAHEANATASESSPLKRTIAGESIRVSIERVEELINLVGELVIANSMVNQAVTTVSPDQAPNLREAVAIMERT